MPNIQDYLDWRGDIPMTRDNVNEVDNMIFCLLSYVNLERVFEALAPQKSMTLREVAKEYFFTHDDAISHPLGLIIPTDILPLFRRLAETPRYQNLELFGFVNEICLEQEVQFSAVTFKMEDGSLFVAFRGTDDSIVGWKEDFKLSYLDEIPSQSKATAYLNALPLEDDTAIFVGGHSKGGNLAVWGATHTRQDVQDRILHVFCNDGPGFTDEMLQSEAYLRLAERTTFLVPQASLVGLLFANDGRYQIVKSRNIGVFQHDGLSWELKGASFVRQEKLKSRGVRTDTVVRERIDGMSREEKKAFVEMFFEVLSSTGANTLSELAENYAKSAFTMLKTFQTFEKEKKDLAIYLLSKLFDLRTPQRKEKESALSAASTNPALQMPHVPSRELPSKSPRRRGRSGIRVEWRIHIFSIHSKRKENLSKC